MQAGNSELMNEWSVAAIIANHKLLRDQIIVTNHLLFVYGFCLSSVLKISQFMLRNYLTIVLLAVAPFRVLAQPADLMPRVDQRVELLSILARLAEYPEYSQTQYRSYVDAIETHFNPYKSHPAVAYMRQLRDSHRIGFDAVMSYAVQLSAPPSLQPLVLFSERLPDSRWTVGGADSLAVLVQGFYRDAHCAAFFQQQAIRYKQAETRFANIVKQVDLPWFQRYYGQPPTQQFHLIIGLANGGGNYGPHLSQAGKADDVYAVMGTWSTDSTGMANYPVDAYLPTVIHEFNHSFVNPLIDQNWAALDKSADLIYTQVQQPMQKQAYASGKTMLYEALVRASVVLYMQEHGPAGDALHQLRDEQYRGFVWADTLVSLLNRYERSRMRYKTLGSFMPEHNAFYNQLSVNVDSLLRDYDGRVPHIAKLEPFANSEKEVDAATAELVIRFDKPLNPKRIGIQLGEGGKSEMPVSDVVGFADGDRTLRLKLRLQPNKSYSFRLRNAGFVTPDGYYFNGETISFKTRP